MQAMQDSRIPWLGSVPSHWKRGKLKQYIFEISEKNSPVKTTDILSLTNKLGIVPYEEKGNQGNTAKEKYDEYKLAYPDTIVANSMNILIGSVGYCSYFGCVSPVYYVFKNLKNGNLKYINYIFQTTEFQKCLRQFSNGILEIRQRVSAKTILNQDFFFPSLDEQKMIVEYLDNKCTQIDTIIAREQSVIEKLQEYRQSIITETVTKGLDATVNMVASNVEWIDNIPSDWKITRFTKSFEFFKGLNIKKTDLVDSGACVVSYGQVHAKNNNGYSLQDNLIRYVAENLIDEKSLLQEGDFVFADTSEDLDGVGNCIYIDSSNEIYAGYHTLVARCFDEGICTKYFAFLFLTDIWRSQLRKNANGTKVYSVTQKMFKTVSCLVPPVEEQLKIVSYLEQKCDAIDRVISQKLTIIDTLAEYKRSLIYEVVTGKKAVSHV